MFIVLANRAQLNFRPYTYCCESDSKLEKLRFLETVNSGLEYECCFCLLVRQKSVAEWRNSGPEFASRKYNRNVFLGQICYNFMGVTFTINIGFVSE